MTVAPLLAEQGGLRQSVEHQAPLQDEVTVCRHLALRQLNPTLPLAQLLHLDGVIGALQPRQGNPGIE